MNNVVLRFDILVCVRMFSFSFSFIVTSMSIPTNSMALWGVLLTDTIWNGWAWVAMLKDP
jgi:hypothetical protein